VVHNVSRSGWGRSAGVRSFLIRKRHVSSPKGC
jgi:hypothetical protein